MFATDTTPVVQVDVLVLSFILGSFVPLVVAVLTRVNASSKVKAWVNLVLSIVAGVVAYMIAHDGTASVLQIATVAITTYLTAGVTYTNFWKPTSVAPVIALKTQNFGLGKAA